MTNDSLDHGFLQSALQRLVHIAAETLEHDSGDPLRDKIKVAFELGRVSNLVVYSWPTDVIDGSTLWLGEMSYSLLRDDPENKLGEVLAKIAALCDRALNTEMYIDLKDLQSEDEWREEFAPFVDGAIH